MRTNILLALDTRRARQDGSYPLIMRLGHQRRTAPISLDIYLQAKDWNEEKRLVRNSYSNGDETATRLNNRLAKQRAKAIDLIEKLEAAQKLQGMKVSELKAFIEKYIDKEEEDPVAIEQKEQAPKPATFFEHSTQIIAGLTEAKRLGTRDSYQDAVGAVEKFHGSKELTFEQIDYEFLMRFENKYYAKGNTANGLAVYMRSIRAVYNSAIKAKIVARDLYPFRDYKIKTTPTRKRALSLEQLNRIINLVLDKDDPLFSARNFFVGSYMMYGMNFTDMAYLTEANIVDGRIQYRRNKTSKLYDIKIIPALRTILNHYRKQSSGTAHVFRIIKRTSAEEQRRDIEWARKRYNKKLKEIAKLCGISGNLTSYVSRHTFATQAMLRKIPLLAISAMLGHSSVKTTQIYLQDLPTQQLDDYNEQILYGGQEKKKVRQIKHQLQKADVAVA
ncbi:site-specific recombinase, phage integrase family [Ostertagia ostertagi]